MVDFDDSRNGRLNKPSAYECFRRLWAQEIIIERECSVYVYKALQVGRSTRIKQSNFSTFSIYLEFLNN
jgi:hypothetical protein